MPRENTVDTYLELKKAIIYRITHINSGEVFDFDGICHFIDAVGAADIDALLQTRDYDSVAL